jgi:hypothetical protein
VVDNVEPKSREIFPPKALLWPGALLASISHAIFVTRAPFLAHEQSWDGPCYNVQDSHGGRGTVVFSDDRIDFVAVAYVTTSKRSFTISDARSRKENELLVGIPARLEELCITALQYLVQEVAEAAAPMITAAFWSDPSEDSIAANEPWWATVENGASLFNKQFLPTDLAIKEWSLEFELRPFEIQLILDLFYRRLNSLDGLLELTSAEVERLYDIAGVSGELSASEESLREVGITFPNVKP